MNYFKMVDLKVCVKIGRLRVHILGEILILACSGNNQNPLLLAIVWISGIN